MKFTRFTRLAASTALAAALVTVPSTGAQEAPEPGSSAAQTVAAPAADGTPAPGTPSAEGANQDQPTTLWLRILEGSSQGPAGVVIAILFGIIGIGMAAYQQFGQYLPKLG